MNRNNKEDTTVKSLKIEKFKSLNLAALFIASVTLASCSSDDGDSEPKNVLEAGKTYILTVDARKGSDVTTRALNLSGSTLNATWAIGEKVFVKQYDKCLGGFLSPDANGETARLNGEINNITGELPQYLFLQYPRQTWNYTGQDGTIADIAANFDYATATAHITEIYGSNISASSSVTFTNQQAIVKFILKNGNNHVNPTSLRISASGLNSGESVMDDIVITPNGSTNEIFCALRGVTGNLILTATTAEGIYTYRKTSVSFANGQYYEITVPMKVKNYPITLSEVTPHYIGSVVGSDGQVYANASCVPTEYTAVAMIAHVSNTGQGLAFALADESNSQLINFEAARTAVSSKTAVLGGTWRIPTLADWNGIIASCNSYDAINSKLSAAGGSQLDGNYWAVDDMYYGGNTISKIGNGINSSAASSEYDTNILRACLAF